MSSLTRWWPAGAALLLMIALVVAFTRGRVGPAPLPILPSPIRIEARTADQGQDDTQQGTGRPLFPQAVPQSTDPTAKTAPQLPVLVGIAGGRGMVVALLKQADGKIVRAHLGEALDGWVVRSISLRTVTIGNAQGEQQLVLSASKD